MKGKKTLNEFREFISRGNVVDLAVGVIIGGAFTGIVNSLVKDIFMPVLSIIIGKIDFSNLQYVMDLYNGERVVIPYGTFIQNVINFFIISAVIFILIKQMNRFKRKEETQEEPKVPADIQLLTEIRDLLKAEQATEHLNE